MSSLLFELKKNNHKDIFEICNNSNEKNPIKLISECNSPNRNNKFPKEKKFPNNFKIERKRKYTDNILELKPNLKEEINDDYKNMKHNSDKRMNLKISRNISKELKYEDNEYLSHKYINTVRNNNKFISEKYNNCSPIKFNKNRKFIEGSPLVSHSIDIINNNPYNKKRFIKIVNKRENDINKILNKNNNNEDFIEENILHKNINISPINFNNRYDKKTKNNYIIRKLSFDHPQDEVDLKTNINSKKEILPDIYSHNNDKEKNLKYQIADSCKELNRKTNLINYKFLFETKKINKEEINKLISHKIDNDFFENKMIQLKHANNKTIPLKLNDLYKSQKHIKEEESFVKEKENIEVISDDELKEYYIEKCNIILEFAYKEDRNKNHKINMEDKGKSIFNFNNDPNQLLFCLFDGHGGDKVSTYLQKNFWKKMKNYVDEFYDEIDFNQLFKEIDEEFKSCKYYKNGSTATIIYIKKDSITKQKFLYCVNIGDTRCILTQTNGSRKLSYDDLVSDENEYNRIIDDDGYIKNYRVCGELMISRAFGDWEYKTHGVICSPHVTKIEINDKCKYIVLASDGIWDVLDDLDVYKYSLTAENSKTLCDDIIQTALEKDTTDNISCFVIKLNY